MKRAALAAALFFSVFVSAHARAKPVRVAPSSDGFVGAWLGAGPFTTAQIDDLDFSAVELRETAKAGGGNFPPRWRVVSGSPGSMDLGKIFGVGRKAGPRAILAADVVVARDVDAWLLLSCDGALRVWHAGREVFVRRGNHERAEAWQLIPLELSAGSNRLFMLLEHMGGRWSFESRLLDRDRLLPPSGASLLLPGTDDADAQRLSSALLEMSSRPGLYKRGYRPVVRFDFPRGAPRDVPMKASVAGRLPGAAKLGFELGEVQVGERGAHALEATLRRISAEELDASGRPQKLELSLTLGKTKTTHSLSLSAGAPQAMARAVELQREVEDGKHSHLSEPSATGATLERYQQLLRKAGSVRQTAKRSVSGALEQLEAFVDTVLDGSDPFHDWRGIHTYALRSRQDLSAQPVLVHVPESYRRGKKRQYPLVVVLHGYNGTPESVTSAFLDSKGVAPWVNGFILAPGAHGNAFYRGPGEQSVVDAIQWAMKTYPIDRRRVSITGVSMGGTGSAFVAFRHADLFAAASPLCGYHSYFVRRDTSGRRRRPWEESRMHHWSPASWADNGRNLPLWVAHGTEDYPLENSRVLVDRYRELGYRMTDEWPDIGHRVWEITWRGAQMWPWLTKHRREKAPMHVTIKTDSLRHGEQDWARITALEAPGQMARLDARLGGPAHILVEAEGVRAFSLDRPSPRLKKRSSVSVQIDGQQLGYGPSEPLAAIRSEDRWQRGEYVRPPGSKRRGVEGPIRDAFLEPLVLVYGSLDPRTTRANREVARHVSRLRFGADVEYPMVRDVDLDEKTTDVSGLLLVGNQKDHFILRRFGEQLPIRAEGGAIVVGEDRIEGRDVGAIFVHPNPEAPHRYVIVVTAPEATGIWRVLSLPQLLPDFLVYDVDVAPASGQQLLDTASVRAGGFFTDRWALPENVSDPFAPKRSTPPSASVPGATSANPPAASSSPAP